MPNRLGSVTLILAALLATAGSAYASPVPVPDGGSASLLLSLGLLGLGYLHRMLRK